MMFKSGDRQEYDPKISWLNYFNMEFTSTSKFQKVAPSKKKSYMEKLTSTKLSYM